MEACTYCGLPFDHEYLGKYGCPNCEGEMNDDTNPESHCECGIAKTYQRTPSGWKWLHKSGDRLAHARYIENRAWEKYIAKSCLTGPETKPAGATG